MHLSSEFEALHRWVKDKVENQIGTKSYKIISLCKKMPVDQFVSLIKAYIQLNGGREIEFNSDYTAIRIYGKRESFLNIKEK